jgi:multisubunit Na+/H+ antiporter MnhB subunit
LLTTSVLFLRLLTTFVFFPRLLTSFDEFFDDFIKVVVNAIMAEEIVCGGFIDFRVIFVFVLVFVTN